MAENIWDGRFRRLYSMIDKGIQIFFDEFKKNLELICESSDPAGMRQRAQVMSTQINYFRESCLGNSMRSRLTDLFALNELLDVREEESFFQWLLVRQKYFTIERCSYLSEHSHWRVYTGDPIPEFASESVEWTDDAPYGRLQDGEQTYFCFHSAGELRLILAGEDVSLKSSGSVKGDYRDLQLRLFLKIIGNVFPRVIPVLKKEKVPVLKKHGLIAADEKSLALLTQLRKAAGTDITILLEGESGTGKEVLANYIHLSSSRAKKSFVAVNCAAIPEGLIESELFGHEKGAFTGAVNRHQGKVELADHGTLFLDEIGEMDPKVQAKLLRFLQLKEFHRVGGKEKLSVDVRIIAATNRDLRKAIEENRFRDDLFFRLSVMPFVVPPLKDRRGDLLPLFHHFLRHYARQFNLPLPSVAQNVYECLFSYPFSGNIRELENLVQNMLVQSQGRKINMEHVPPGLLGYSTDEKVPFYTLKNTPPDESGQESDSKSTGTSSDLPLPGTKEELKEQKALIQEQSRLEQLKLEKAFLNHLLEETGWIISEASKVSGINRTMLYKMMERNGIKP